MHSYQQKIVIIIFNNKMTNNYAWNTDKQNKYNLDSASSRPKGSITTNNALRKKIEENLTLAERDKNYQIQGSQHNKCENYKIEEYNFNQAAPSKRDNARKRGFDMRVSNIQNINEKIAGLLSMVNKDKNSQKELNKELERSNDYELRARDKTPPHYQNNDKITNLSNKSNNASGKKYSNQESKIYKYPAGKVENFQRKKVVSTFQADQSIAHQNQIQNIRQIRMNFYQQQRKKRENELPKFTPNRNQKLQESSRIDQSFRENQSKKFDLKAAVRSRQQAFQKMPKSQYQKMDIQKMIDQRRKQRFTYGESERDLSPSIIQRKSALKMTKDSKQGQIKYNKQKESPIQAVKSEFSYTYNNLAQDNYQEIYRNNFSPSQGHSRRQSDLQNLSKLSYLEEEPFKQQRNAPSTRLIDEQLNKIKTKIIESQNNKKKIERFKPTTEFQAQGEVSKTQICRIANSISSQVEVDANLRASRDSFCKIPGESKWSQLQNLAVQKGLNLKGDHLKQLITIGADEHNPFVSQKSSISMEQFVTLLVASQKNWEHMVMKCASARSLMNENFDVKDLDLSGKGYLALEDIVCFVNLYSNTFYRNRDLALVMRRLQMVQGGCRKGGIEYKTFLSTFVG